MYVDVASLTYFSPLSRFAKVLRGLCASHRESDPMAIHLRSMRAALRVPGLEVPKPNIWLGVGIIL